MRLYELLNEAPFMLDDSDFEMELEPINRSTTSDLMKNSEIIYEDDNFYLFNKEMFPGDYQMGLVSKTKPPKTTYFVQYERKHIPKIGFGVTQTMVWRNSAAIPEIAKKVFFDYLVNKYDTVFTDDEQTPAGKKFWVKRMQEAFDKGLTVGMTDDKGSFILYDGSNDIENWIEKTQAYGDEDDTFYNYRFFITNKNL